MKFGGGNEAKSCIWYFSDVLVHPEWGSKQILHMVFSMILESYKYPFLLKKKIIILVWFINNVFTVIMVKYRIDLLSDKNYALEYGACLGCSTNKSNKFNTLRLLCTVISSQQQNSVLCLFCFFFFQPSNVFVLFCFAMNWHQDKWKVGKLFLLSFFHYIDKGSWK